MAEIKKYYVTPRKGDYYGAEVQAADDPAEIVRDLAARLDTLQRAGAAYSVTTKNDVLILETGAYEIVPSTAIQVTRTAAVSSREIVEGIATSIAEFRARMDEMHAQIAACLLPRCSTNPAPEKPVKVAKRSPAKARR